MFDGPTLQATHPIPPVNQPLFSYYRADVNRYLWEGPDQVFDGATSQQTYVFPNGLVEQSSYSILQRNRFLLGSAPFLDTIVAASQPTYIFPVSNPEMTGFALSHRNRFLVSVRRMDDGATVQQTSIFQPNQPELSRFSSLQHSRSIVPAKPFIETLSTVLFQQYLFPVSLPEQASWARQQFPRSTVQATRILDGATIQQIQVFTPNQPDPSATSVFINRPRYSSEPRKQFDGAAISQSYIPQVIPDLGTRYAFIARRATPQGQLRLESPTVSSVQSDIFILNQPQGVVDRLRALFATAWELIHPNSGLSSLSVINTNAYPLSLTLNASPIGTTKTAMPLGKTRIADPVIH